MTDKMLSQGLWRPDAKVLCVHCHIKQCGNTYGFSDRLKPIDMDLYKKRVCGEYELEAACQTCGTPIWMMEKVALEQRVVLALIEKGCLPLTAHMQQTGGMCSAAEVMFPGRDGDGDGDYEYLWVTYAENDGDPLYYCGWYRTTEDGSGDQEEYVDEPMTFEGVLTWVDEQFQEYEGRTA